MGARKSVILLTALVPTLGASEIVRADGPYALVSGRRDPAVIVVDLERALAPESDGTSNAVISRVRVTPDVDTDGDGVPDTPAAGLPSNIVLAMDGSFALVVNHAGNATPDRVAVSQHGHPGTVTILDVRAALNPANDRTTNAIEAVIPSGGFGPVGLTQAEDPRFALVGNSEGDGKEDGAREIGIIDLGRRELVRVLRLRLGAGGEVAQAPGASCRDLVASPALVPRSLPDGNVGCFPDINGIGIGGPGGGFAFTANGGTDDVSVIHAQRAIDGEPDAELARIPVARGPWGLAVSPDGTLVAVSNRESAETGVEGNTVSILDAGPAVEGHPGAEVARIRLGTGEAATRPFGLAFTPDGRHLVATGFRTDHVSIIDVRSAVGDATGVEAAHVALVRPDAGPARPRGVAVTPDGRFAAVSGGGPGAPGGGVLWLIDLEAVTVVSTVTGVGDEPYLLAITAGVE